MIPRMASMAFYLAPNFLERLNVFAEVSKDGDASFRCSFMAHPEPKVCWFKDDNQISGNGRTLFSQTPGDNETILCLTVNRVTKEDEGAYRCTVENSEGVASTTGYLSVFDLSARITDVEPIDQSMIELLLLRSSSENVTSKAYSGENISQPSNLNLTKNSSNTKINFSETSDHSTETESLVTFIYGSVNSDERDKREVIENLDQNVPKNQNFKDIDSKNPEEDETVVNICTLMTSDNNLHDSFKPIEINKLNSDKLPIPSDDVNKNQISTEGRSGHLTTLSLGEKFVQVPLAMDFVNSQQSLNSNLILQNKTSGGDFEIENSTEGKRISEKQISDEIDDGGEASCVSNADIVKTDSEIRGVNQIFTENDSMNESLLSFRNKMAGDCSKIKPDAVGTTKFQRTPPFLPHSISCGPENSTKALKWLKLNHDLISLANGSDNQQGCQDGGSIMLRKKTDKPDRKVSYNINQCHASSDRTSVSTPDNAQFSGTTSAKTDPLLTWNNALTKLFQFPRVISVFFILIATMSFLYLQMNPILVTVIVSIIWTLVIHIFPTVLDITWSKE